MDKEMEPWAMHKEPGYLYEANLRLLYFMAMKATPGPWKYEGSESYGIVETAYDPEKKRTTGSSGNEHICCLKDGEYFDWENEEEQHATGRFIAHAHPGVVKYLIKEVLLLRKRVGILYGQVHDMTKEQGSSPG